MKETCVRVQSDFFQYQWPQKKNKLSSLKANACYSMSEVKQHPKQTNVPSASHLRTTIGPLVWPYPAVAWIMHMYEGFNIRTCITTFFMWYRILLVALLSTPFSFPFLVYMSKIEMYNNVYTYSIIINPLFLSLQNSSVPPCLSTKWQVAFDPMPWSYVQCVEPEEILAKHQTPAVLLQPKKQLTCLTPVNLAAFFSFCVFGKK